MSQPYRAIIRKSNELVNARFSFSMPEHRVFLTLLTLIKSDDIDFKTYAFRAADFMQAFWITSKDVYGSLERVTDSLLKKIIRIQGVKNGKATVFKTTLVSSFDYLRDGTGFIKATIHPDLKPYLLQLKSKYLSYYLRNVARLSSAHSLRMYEILKQYESIGSRTLALTELKELLGVADKYDDRYHNFKTRIILQAQKELAKHTDLAFAFSELKLGRNVDKIRFEIRRNPANAAPEPVCPENRLTDLLTRFGVSPDQNLLELLQKQPVNVVEAACLKAKKLFGEKRKTGQPIANEGGYLMKLLSTPAYLAGVAVEVKKAVKKRRWQPRRASWEPSKPSFKPSWPPKRRI